MADNLLNQTLATAREFTRPLRETLFPSPNKKTIEQRLKEAIAKGDKEEVKRLNAEAGTLSAFTGVYTGLPDLGVLGYNWATSSNIKDLRTKVLEATGVPTKASDTDNELAYNLPDYAAMAVGLHQLVKGTKAGVSKWRDSRRMKDFLADLETSSGKDTANFFEKFMVTGQGSDNPMVHAALTQMKNNPKFAELFTSLDKAATEAALKGMKVRPSSQTSEEAASGIVRSVQDRLSKLVDARNKAGDAAFNKAYALAGDRGIIKPDQTLTALSKLRERFLLSKTPESQKTVDVIDKLQESMLVNGQIKPLSVPEFQQLLSEFGKKVGSEDSIVQGLSQSNLELINKTIFGGLKTDLGLALKTASTTDKQALGALESARVQFKNASESYNKLVAQGIPKFLQGKNVEDISLEDITAAYKGLNQGQRSLFREWVGTNRKESLQALDSQVFNDFLGKAYGTLADGTQGYDLGKLSRAWNELKVKDPNQADMLVQSLGTNAGEFNKRMQDALVFTRKMSVGGLPGEEASKVDRVAKDVGRAAGIASYAAKQGVDLTYDMASTIFKKKGLTDDLIARALLTPEGANFLKEAALSPTSKKTLEALSKVQDASVAHPLYTAISTLSAPATRPADAAQDDVYIPDDVFIPEDLLPKANTAPVGVPQQAGETTDDVYIPDDVLGSVSYSTEPAMKQAAQGTVDEGLTQEQIMQGVIRDNPGVALDELTRRLQAGVNYKP